MWGGVCWVVAAWQVGLGAVWGPRAEPSAANWSAGLDPPSPSPPTWTTPLARSTDGAPGEQEPPACRGEEDCPPWSSCEEQAGRNSCHCGLGYHLSPTLGCVPVKAFPGRLSLWDLGSPNWSLLGITSAESRLPWVTLQIQSSFQHILGHLDGYLGSFARDLKWPSSEVTLFHHFSTRAPVTSRQVAEAVAAFQAQCHESSSHVEGPACALLRQAGPYQSLSLCDFDICDSLSTRCSFQDGLVRCSCRPGHFQAHPADRTCTECGSGFWLQNGTCTRCPFGFGGAGCQEPFLLALVVVSGLAGLLLLLLILGSLSSLTISASSIFSGRSSSFFPSLG
ncbi:protein HEG-like isoform X2 [Zootoca vivipara]|uniref:protein HEG-like isoform X2 n=1 Tax=Zootoca vivipara TaxID=8524 RepID=UPI00293B9B39|nr:protein HEG-like isoform X2 [Zootoca vivipara]